jgi:glycosyltransferase involved in cell wall biosynthesis
LFVEQADLVRAEFTGSLVHFVWVGKVFDDEFTRSIMRQVRERGLSNVFHFVGEHERPVELFCGCDVFVLSSREEPMGLVALEAATVGKPIVCFAEAGGMPDFVESDCGRAVSPMTGEALARAVVEILSSVELRNLLGRGAFEKVRRTHHIDFVAPQILNVIKDVIETDPVRQNSSRSDRYSEEAARAL